MAESEGGTAKVCDFLKYGARVSQLQPGFPSSPQASTFTFEVATKACPLMALDPPRTRPYGIVITLLWRADCNWESNYVPAEPLKIN